MILEQGNSWGMLRGKMSTTPEQALENFGFTQDPTAEGVIFRVYRVVGADGKVHLENRIANYKKAGNPQTPAQTAGRNKFAYLIKTACEHQHTMMHPIWKLEADRRERPLTPQNFFVSWNMRKMSSATDYINMVVSYGILEPAELLTGTKIGTHYYDITWSTNIQSNGNANDLPNACLVDKETGTLYEGIPTHTYTRSDGAGQWIFGVNTPEAVLYLYFKRDNLYSISKSKEVLLMLTYTELISAYFQSTPSLAWQTKDLSAIIPENCIYVDVIAYNTVTSAGYDAGVRTNGSALDRKVILGSYESITWRVKPDASRIIETYAGTSYIRFKIIGYLRYE